MAFLLFAVVAAVTPGPSNIMLTAVGAQAGVLRGLLALLGVTTGMGVMMFVVPLGLGSLVLETKAAGLAGIVIWGLHRDTREIAAIGLPVFSLGGFPTGPLRLNARGPDALQWAAVGPHRVSTSDYVVADDDGVLFLPRDGLADVVSFARKIRDTEARQAEAMAAGTSLRQQLRFDDYLSRRRGDPTYAFRQHLRDIAGAIEE